MTTNNDTEKNIDDLINKIIEGTSYTSEVGGGWGGTWEAKWSLYPMFIFPLKRPVYTVRVILVATDAEEGINLGNLSKNLNTFVFSSDYKDYREYIEDITWGTGNILDGSLGYLEALEETRDNIKKTERWII